MRACALDERGRPSSAPAGRRSRPALAETCVYLFSAVRCRSVGAVTQTSDRHTRHSTRHSVASVPVKAARAATERHARARVHAKKRDKRYKVKERRGRKGRTGRKGRSYLNARIQYSERASGPSVTGLTELHVQHAVVSRILLTRINVEQ